MPRSEQVQRVMDRYGVTTQKALLRAVRDEYQRETCDEGETVSLATAEVILDRMYEAEYQRIAGGAYDPEPEPVYTLSYEQRQDPDPERFFPVDDRPAIERYGTPEHEAWLVEMERLEG